MKRRNSINGQFAARLIEMLESPAYRVLSRSGHMVIARIEIELASHGGNDNGRLPVTTDNFVEYGMHRTSVAPAIREAEALGFIRITERGHGGNAARQFEVMTKSSNGRGKLGPSGLHSTASCRRLSSHTSYYNAAALWLYRRPEMGYQAAFRHRAGERRHAPAVFGADTSLNIGATVPAGALGER